MKRNALVITGWIGLLGALWAGAVGASTPLEGYLLLDAATMRQSPQQAWARAVFFSDQLVASPDGAARRLGRQLYAPMRLAETGTVWVPESRAELFRALPVGETLFFGGTVDQIRRRYYILVDECYLLQTAADLTEHWVDMLAQPPPAEAEPAPAVEPLPPVVESDAEESLTEPEPEPAPPKPRRTRAPKPAPEPPVSVAPESVPDWMRPVGF